VEQKTAFSWHTSTRPGWALEGLSAKTTAVVGEKRRLIGIKGAATDLRHSEDIEDDNADNT
jgi:hypothetical protein